MRGARLGLYDLSPDHDQAAECRARLFHNGKVVEGVRLRGAAILDDNTHARIVALYAARRRGRQPSGRYVLTGIAVCGLCDSGLAGRPITGTGRRH